jgi:hypothetical protein
VRSARAAVIETVHRITFPALTLSADLHRYECAPSVHVVTIPTYMNGKWRPNRERNPSDRARTSGSVTASMNREEQRQAAQQRIQADDLLIAEEQEVLDAVSRQTGAIRQSRARRQSRAAAHGDCRVTMNASVTCGNRTQQQPRARRRPATREKRHARGEW